MPKPFSCGLAKSVLSKGWYSIMTCILFCSKDINGLAIVMSELSVDESCSVIVYCH